ncbi:MAG: 4Fe-4S binding protein [candidate division Zixibacteria bacterium]|nr:4Fe-4S binding protein [candidate division Zixibacteria bacterium]
MPDNAYNDLADALDRLPNGFPRTKSGVEIQILKKIFTPEEASIACQLTGEMELVDNIAERIGLLPKEARSKLLRMAKRGLVWPNKHDGKMYFRLAPFIVGIFEEHLENMDHEFAHLFDMYMLEGGAEGIMKYNPALHRVVPSTSLAKSEWILPYDDVRAIIENTKAFSVRDCICRAQQAHVGKRCEYPLHNCLMLSYKERPPKPGDITKEQALAILDQAEDVGLVHTVSNVKEGLGYICNCCGCCCGILRGITEYGIKESVAHANYFAVIDPDECTGCGTCIERCQVNAIIEQDGISVVEKDGCIGCGLCVTGCPDNAAKLQLKPADEIIEPPADYAVWEQERLRSRGMR